MKEHQKPLLTFADLIEEIEVKGERFIPIERLAMLAFNYNLETVQNNAMSWVNRQYENAAHYAFETKILLPRKHKVSMVVWPSFDIWCYHDIEGVERQSNSGMPPCNQIEIARCLAKWGFIDLK